MTLDTSAVVPSQDPIQGFLEIWRACISQVLEQISGSAMACALSGEKPAAMDETAATDLWMVVSFAGSLRGEMALRMTATTTVRLAQLFMGEMATPAAEPAAGVAASEEQRDAVIELMRQIAGVVVTAAKERWGEIQLGVETAASAPSWPAAASFRLCAGEEGKYLLETGVSAALAAELRAERTDPHKSAETQHELGENPEAASADALQHLLEVQLGLSLRFGSKTLLLREVLDLGPGSVVELDRKVQEPVDLLLEGRVVARGDLVVVEGNYGLRVTDVSPLEKS